MIASIDPLHLPEARVPQTALRSWFCRQCAGAMRIGGFMPGIDLVQARDGSWFILEDNLRVPSGASYPMIARS